MKINYKRTYDKDGAGYTQTVTMALTAKQINEINAKISKLSFARIFKDRFIIREGVNFVTLSSAAIIAEYTGLNKNRRYKSERNTAFKISIA